MRDGASWPNADPATAHAAGATSVIGLLRAHSGLDYYLDLPTGAQWEYAARAGVGTSYTDGTTPTVSTGVEPALEGIARYKGNAGTVSDPAAADTTVGTARVGSYAANRWGLYDTLGNVAEWVLEQRGSYDGYSTSEVYEDPDGSISSWGGTGRLLRGGGWSSAISHVRLGDNNIDVQNIWVPGQISNIHGFRLAYTLVDE